MQHGFQRLVLLGSAGYSRAELPLDGAVSLVAPNNTGKTSLINALQFLLIIDRRRMDFGAHDVEKSRRFYFPNNSAYVLLEVSLPESGTVVLGCVGKGVSFEYEYFAYAGPLKVEEFCLELFLSGHHSLLCRNFHCHHNFINLGNRNVYLCRNLLHSEETCEKHTFYLTNHILTDYFVCSCLSNLNTV